MSKFCTNCGATLDDDAAFCPECGARLDETPAEETPFAPAEPEHDSAFDFRPEPQEEIRPRQETVKPEQVQQTAPPAPEPVPVPVPEAPAEPPKRSKEISTGGYFWLMLLFAVPVIGFIAMLIFASAVKNRNLRNFARAHVVWVVVLLILAILLWIVTKLALKAAGVVIDWASLFDNIKNAVPFWN